MARSAFVSGCFDMLHSGHVAFFRSAAQYGDLYVALGSDRTVFDLKGRPTVNTEEERLYMVQSLDCVHCAFISRGSGILDFAEELREVHPDCFVVNEDGDIPAKRQACEELGVDYVVLERLPDGGMPPRSTTDLRSMDQIPYRIDLCGGWLDQPFVSEHCPGAVITVSVEPTVEFNERSGMATSTRRAAHEIWGNRLPVDDLEKVARILFCCENPPGKDYVSGSQDSIGVVYPGLARADYGGEYWPDKIQHVVEPRLLDFVEGALYLRPLGPRDSEYDALSVRHIDEAGARALATAADDCWSAILDMDLERFGGAVLAGFDAQIAMFPHMTNVGVEALIDQYRDTALGWKLCGSGGGGYLVLVSETPIEHALRVVVRREIT